MSDKNKQEKLQELYKRLEDIDFCMISTIGRNGRIHSRPMSTQAVDADGTLWFFTSDESLKAGELEKNPQVNISYVKIEKDIYISVSGKGKISKDAQKMKQLWKPVLKAWFPDGLEQPDIALLSVSVEEVEYWAPENGKLVEIFEFVKSIVAGEGPDEDKNHGKLKV